MNIPHNSFISLVEYPDPNVVRVTWKAIDGDGTAAMIYREEAEINRVNEIVKQQHDLTRDTPASDRAEALRTLAKSRIDG